MQNISEQLNSVDLFFSPDQKTQIDKLLEIDKVISNKNLDLYFKKLMYPVLDGELCVYHHKPKNPIASKAIVFVAGWGSSLHSFIDCYQSIVNKVEIYHIETREKNSSRINITKTNMTIEQYAQDIADILASLNFNNPDDYLIAGACWGSSIILKGLIKNILPTTTYVLFDPMHALWFPKWLLNYIIPIVPVWLAKIIKPIGKRIALFGMKEPVQRKRSSDFIDNGDMRKWKQAAIQAKDFALIGNLHCIKKEVFIVNGTKDKIHDQRYYPLIAAGIPKGRFLFMKTDESNRELLIGRILYKFATMNMEQMLPGTLKSFEKVLSRK